jgi:hypothetical protein
MGGCPEEGAFARTCSAKESPGGPVEDGLLAFELEFDELAGFANVDAS